MSDIEPSKTLRRWVDQAFIAACALVVTLIGMVWANTSSRISALEQAASENVAVSVELKTNYKEIIRRLGKIEDALEARNK